jgi:hypothetical protein
MKGIFTIEQVKKIEDQSKNKIYATSGAITFGIGAKSPFAIFNISSKGLIFVKGTDDTGFEHIHQRHSSASNKIFWSKFYNHKGESIDKKDSYGRKSQKLDNPSKFSTDSIPIISYQKISDDVYCKKNLKIKSNKSPEIFDVYENTSIDNIQYRLITYKDSKVVHTLIPLSKKFNKTAKRIINFYRPKEYTTTYTNNGEVFLRTIYKDEFNKVRYVVIIRQTEYEKKWYIQYNKANEEPFLTYHFNNSELSIDIGSKQYIMFLDQFDWSPIEKCIKQMEKGIKVRLVKPADNKRR